MSEAPTMDKLPAALLRVFNNDALERVLLDNLNKKFPDTEFFSYVVKVADEQGWTANLIGEGLKQDPQNRLLKEVALLDPLQAVITSPPDKSHATGSEVDRALRSLIQVLKHIDPSTLSGEMFAELNGYLTGLYQEYKDQTIATIA